MNQLHQSPLQDGDKERRQDQVEQQSDNKYRSEGNKETKALRVIK
ncbi:MAG: hypothetical protein ACI8RD_003983 [Bacillariaceae sp.]|jgi:hypothetical protein